MAEKLKAKSYLGYGIADMGNNLLFSVTGGYLTLFYTDVLGANFDDATAKIWGVAITIIMIIARIWDGINDPIMGYIVQRNKPTKFGKFKHYILYGGIPMAIIGVLMFMPIKNMSLAGCIVFATLTYIAYGMLYTVVLVPYGSIATVMTREQGERSKLSIARAIGGGIGGIPSGMLFPMLVYTKYLDSNGELVKYLDGSKLLVAVVVIAVAVIICYVISFFTIKEQYPYPNEVQKVNFGATLKAVIHNKPFIIISLAGMLLIASSMYMNSVNAYLFNVYYVRTDFMIYFTIATYIPMIALVPFTDKIIKKFGKKEMIVFSLAISTLASLVMALWKIPNPWIYVAFCLIQGFGVGFFTLEIWALAMDIIDYQELITHKREEAPCYALFTFMRKVGQALAAVVPALLSAIGYVSSKGYTGQTVKTANGIYSIATIIPFVLMALMLVLMIFYPLNKKRDLEMREELAKLRATTDAEVK